MNIINSVVTLLLSLGFLARATPSLADSQNIPVEFVDNRIFAKVSFNHVEASLLLDTGGNTGIYPEFAYYWKTGDSKVEKGFLKFGSLSPFKNFPFDVLQGEWIRVMPENEEAAVMRKVMCDGVFGHGWFGRRIWRFNYKNEQLVLLDSSKDVLGEPVDLGLKASTPHAYYYCPRFEIDVSGSKLQMLFDTGATSFLSAEAVKTLGLKNAFSASNFVRESVFDVWRAKNPDWRVIEGGDRFGRQALIEVPEITVAGKKVGPVWFARRPNIAYDEMMAGVMDCKCDGAIGGPVFSKFRSVTIDYVSKKAWFEH
ncbi:MAG: hypothetical protein NT027_05610 [Proteobacteria bacterium]|nr:hypothetical protein [Pseudomonadota bacterium]